MGTSVAPTIATSLVLGALVYKVTDLFKYLRAFWGRNEQTREDGKNGLLSLLLSAVAGVVTVLIFQQTEWAAEITIGERPLANLSLVSAAVFGLVVTSLASTLYDLKKAVDNADSAATPRLMEQSEQVRLDRQAAVGGGRLRPTTARGRGSNGWCASRSAAGRPAGWGRGRAPRSP